MKKKFKNLNGRKNFINLQALMDMGGVISGN
jgi:hypothetical protein